MEKIIRDNRRPVVMVVDDVDIVRSFVRYVLEGAGYEVLEAWNSEDALMQAAGFRGIVDLLLTDQNMKIFLKGSELAKWFLDLHPETRILLTSGSPLPVGTIPAGSGWGLLPKPFSHRQLLKKVCTMTQVHCEEPVPAFLRAT